MYHTSPDLLCFYYSARGVLSLPYTKEELLKYIEEKELLRKRKLPTRQGSRPYSTSCLRYTPRFLYIGYYCSILIWIKFNYNIN